MGDYKSPGFIGQTFFTADFKSAGTPDGRQEYPVRRFDGFAIRRQKMSQPLFMLWGFAIPSNQFVIGGFLVNVKIMKSLGSFIFSSYICRKICKQ